MSEKIFVNNKLSQDEIEKSLEYVNDLCLKLAKKEFEYLDICDYTYTVDKAVDELGLDSELIHQLVKDYANQIFDHKAQFIEYLEELKQLKLLDEELNYKPFRELVHKNLGVAKNLRIFDAQILLTELMNSDDLDYLSLCLEVLEVCTSKLIPEK